MELSQRQTEVLRHSASDATSVFAGGAVRSGKSYSVMLGFALWLLKEDTSSDHAIVGQSIETIMRNVGFDLLTTIEQMGGKAEVSKTFGTRIVVQGKVPQNVWLIGANDAKARRRIQGSTLKGLVVEELALLPEDFFQMAWSRLSVEGAKMWCSYNPEGPAHWAKRTVIDRAREYGGVVIRFYMKDNPTLSAAVIARYEKSFTGHFYKRLIEGQWAAATGACYPEWFTTPHDMETQNVGLALDWGVSTTLACLAIQQDREKAVVARELFHHAKETQVLTENQAAELVIAWWTAHYGSLFKGPRAFAWLDPNTPASFKGLLRKAGFQIRGADNAVIPGIITTGARLASGQILIHERVTELADELASYTWDAAASDKGEDKPTKKSDHGCDALRYFAHTTGKAWRAMQMPKVNEVLR